MSAARDSLCEVVDLTLGWCNEQRAEQGQEPLESLPKGAMDDPESCPCGRATGLYVDHKTFALTQASWREGTRHPLPDAVVDFVRAFDDGLLPEYEEPRPDEQEWEAEDGD